MVHFFESTMEYDLILNGIRGYHIVAAQFFILQLHTGISLIATNSDVLISKFSAHTAFQAISLNRDELSYRIGDIPVTLKTGNPNLMPLY